MTNFIDYTINNIEPITIADKNSSQGNQMDTLKFIPGSTIRGLVINELSKKSNFEDIKNILFSENVRFMNAYLSTSNKECIPSPKGFYEDKTVSEKKKIENIVLNGEFSDGFKRASLGDSCYFDNDCVKFMTVETGENMNISVSAKDIYRSRHIQKNQSFRGFIAFNDKAKDVLEDVKDVLNKTDIKLGNRRTKGYGKCKITNINITNNLPYSVYHATKSQNEFCYMMLLSSTTMVNEFGEVVGIDLNYLQDILNVSNLKIELCSTSTVNVAGYNATMKSRIPTNIMYQTGSVFKLEYTGTISAETLNKVSEKGIGIRKNEGFGQVLFLDSKMYKKISYKTKAQVYKGKVEGYKASKEDLQVLKIAAKSYITNIINKAMQKYVVDNELKKGSVKNSQLGTILSLATSLRYSPNLAQLNLKNYIDHANQKDSSKKTHKETATRKEIGSFIYYILDNDLFKILNIDKQNTIFGIESNGLLDSEEIISYKLQLIIDMIKYYNKVSKGGRA